ncbi:MAG: hypothetical protein U5N58_11820 [Actinomycetota bacterium]|nr:hypothetical protein [Actinomycetota bacterium]
MVKQKKSSKNIKGWIIAITAWTFLLAIILSFISETLIVNVELIPALVILIIIISIGVSADIVGVAVTAATEVPLNAMSSKKIKGAREAVNLIKNADRVANFCNDVVGDIAGIVSGSVGAAIVFRLIIGNPTLEKTLLSVVITGFVASLTVGERL